MYAMCAYDEEMTMTPALKNSLQERISLEDLALAKRALDFYLRNSERRTYDFNITSDSVPQREETQS